MSLGPEHPPRAFISLKARWRRVISGPQGAQSGSATIELVLATPLLLLLMLLIVQTAMWMHANHIAQAAASRAVEDTRIHGGSAWQGQATGASSLRTLGGTLIHDPQVTATRTATEATVDITATATSIIPGWRWNIRAHVTAPVEVFSGGGP